MYTHYNGHDEKDTQHQAGKDVEQPRLSNTVRGSATWCRRFGNLWQNPPKLSKHGHQDLAIPPLAIYPNEICTTITENLDQECAALFVTAPS